MSLGRCHWATGKWHKDKDDKENLIERTLLGCIRYHNLTVASSGKQALQCISSISGAFDVILMDMMMPDLDGCETTRKIKKISGASFPFLTPSHTHTLSLSLSLSVTNYSDVSSENILSLHIVIFSSSKF